MAGQSHEAGGWSQSGKWCISVPLRVLLLSVVPSKDAVRCSRGVYMQSWRDTMCDTLGTGSGPHAKTPVLSEPAQEVSGSVLTLWPTSVGLPQTDRETDMPA